MNRTEKAERFRELHKGPEILVLPNAWDAASAAVMADAGAKAVATSSAAVAWAHGYPDGDALPIDKAATTVAAVVKAAGDIPVTADIEGGYADDLDELSRNIARVIEAGAVGINLEDGTRDPALHARKVAATRAVAEKLGVPLFINARIDIYLRGLAEGEAAYDESVRRAALYTQAGADGIFVPGPSDADLIRRLAQAIERPLNIILFPHTPDAATLQELGVRRLSSGTAPFRAAYATAAKAVGEYLKTGAVAAFAAGAEGLPNLNKRLGA